MKICTRCKVNYPRTFYYERKKGTGILVSICKECSTKAAEKWRTDNLERYNEYHRNYAKSHKSKISIDQRRENRARWIANNPEARKLNRKNDKIKRKLVEGKISTGRIAALLTLQKHKCPCCKLPLGKDYHIDHIIPLSKGGLNIDSNIQLLRKECNLRKSKKHPIDFMQENGFLC